MLVSISLWSNWFCYATFCLKSVCKNLSTLSEDLLHLAKGNGKVENGLAQIVHSWSKDIADLKQVSVRRKEWVGFLLLPR